MTRPFLRVGGKKTARDIYERTLDIEFERDRSIGLGSTVGDNQTDRQTDRHTHTHTDTDTHTGCLSYKSFFFFKKETRLKKDSSCDCLFYNMK